MSVFRLHAPSNVIAVLVAASPVWWGPATARAQTAAETTTKATATATALERCAAVGAAADRLACYDHLAGRAEAPSLPTAEQAGPARTSTLAAKDAPVGSPSQPVGSSGSGLLSKFWELDDADKRGTFNFVGYRPNYVLPLHASSRINRAPQSPTQNAVLLPDYRKEEAKFQLSLRTKIAQDLLSSGADVWLGFTQQASWQIWNGADSKPFRSTDYEPEAIVVLPTPASLRGLPFGWLGWQWRFAQLALAHQSNGQSDPLSRSWNRVYAGAGFDRGDWSLTARVAHRLKEDAANDNNPDLINYRGRAEFQLNWAPGSHTASLQYRTSFRGGSNGSLQAGWTFPVFAGQPNGLRWYLQAFSGYAETLIDYNFRQTSVGAGVTFLQF